MHTRFLTLALGSLFALGAAAALAQNNPPPPPDQNQAAPPPPFGRGMRMDPDRQLAHLTQALGLTSAQQDQIKPLLVERQRKMQSIFQNQSLAPEDRRAEVRSTVEGTNNSIKALLTEEQKQKFADMQQRMRRNMRGPGAGGPPPPDGTTPQPQN